MFQLPADRNKNNRKKKHHQLLSYPHYYIYWRFYDVWYEMVSVWVVNGDLKCRCKEVNNNNITHCLAAIFELLRYFYIIKWKWEKSSTGFYNRASFCCCFYLDILYILFKINLLLFQFFRASKSIFVHGFSFERHFCVKTKLSHTDGWLYSNKNIFCYLFDDFWKCELWSGVMYVCIFGLVAIHQAKE